MSVAQFRRCILLSTLADGDKTWFPKWFGAYARFAFKRVQDGPKSIDDENFAVPVLEPVVISFLQSLRDSGTPAWQRLQAARAIDMYASVVVRTCDIDFTFIIDKLRELSGREKQLGSNPEAAQVEVAGEGSTGTLDDEEPEILRKMRERMRLMHHPISTEKAYTQWVNRFITQFCNANARRWCRHSYCTRTPWTQGCKDYYDLYTRDESAWIGCGKPFGSIGISVISSFGG